MAGNNKTWKDVWDLYWNEKVRDLHTSFPARITRIDHELNRCDVAPVVSTKYPDNTQLQFPELTKLPYQIYSSSAGKARFTVPLKKGDIVMVNVSERDLSIFKTSDAKGVYNSRTLSSHDLNSALVTPCFYTTETAREVDPVNIVIEHGTTTIKIAPDGDITIDSSKKVVITAEETIINSNVKVNGTLTVSDVVSFEGTLDVIGNVTFSGDLMTTGSLSGGGISLSAHIHSGVTSGPDLTSPAETAPVDTP